MNRSPMRQAFKRFEEIERFKNPKQIDNNTATQDVREFITINQAKAKLNAASLN